MESRIFHARRYFHIVSAKNGDVYRRSCKAVFSMHSRILDVFLQGIVTHIDDDVKPKETHVHTYTFYTHARTHKETHIDLIKAEA